MSWGDPGEKFYILIKGSVKVLVPNPRIKDSKDLMKDRYEEIKQLETDLEDLDKLIEIKQSITLELERNNLA